MSPTTRHTPLALVASTGTTTLVLVTLLVALGVGMILVAVWLVRTTRTDAPALGPLEAMSGRRWSSTSQERRSARLARARPDGAPPPAPMVPPDDESAESDVPPDVPDVPDEGAAVAVAAGVEHVRPEGGDPTPVGDEQPALDGCAAVGETAADVGTDDAPPAVDGDDEPAGEPAAADVGASESADADAETVAEDAGSEPVPADADVATQDDADAEDTLGGPEPVDVVATQADRPTGADTGTESPPVADADGEPLPEATDDDAGAAANGHGETAPAPASEPS